MVTRKHICLAILLCCSSVSAFATVNSRISQTVMNQGESVRLTIDLSGLDGDKVDLTPLEGKFDILQRRQQSGVTMVNGDIQRTSELILVLLPKQSGDVTVPAIEVDGDKTSPHAIRVTKVELPAAIDGGLELLSSLSSETPRVQQPIVYTASLLLGRQVYNASLQPPTLATGKAVIEPLGDQSQHQQSIKGQSITVVVQSWLITPEQSGPLAINAALLVGEIPSAQASNRSLGGRYIDPNSLRRIQLTADSYQLDVTGIPADYKGATWLPAQSLDLSEQWSSDSFRVGEPVTRTIAVEAEGLTSHQLATLVLPDSTGLKQYAGTPQISQSYTDGVLKSTMTVEVTLIPAQQGAVDVPALNMSWWNVNTDSEEVASLPTRSIKVEAGSVASAPIQDQNTQSRNPVQVRQPLPATTQPESMPADSTVNASVVASGRQDTSTWLDYWWLALVAAILGSVVTLILSRLLPRRVSPSALGASSRTNSGKVNASLARIKQACADNNAGELRLALIEWGREIWPDCNNLNALAQKVSPELKIVIADLQRQAYSQPTSEGSIHWQGSDFWDAIKGYKPEITHSKNEALVPLSPIHSTY